LSISGIIDTTIMATEEPNQTPAPTQSAETATAPPASDAQAPATPTEARITAEPLSDGTVPTVLSENSSGQSSVPAPKLNNRAISSVYRKADIATSLITMTATLAVVGIVLGGYLFLTKKKPVPPAKITTLDQTEITKLGGFLSGNALGSSNQILNVTASSLFKGRLAVDNDIKVTGNGDFSGTISTSSLTVTKSTTLSNTNINGPLIVTGPTTLQSPAILAGGATIGNNLSVAGNGTFGGAVSAGSFNARTITVTGDVNLSGHLVITGSLPTVSPEIGAGNGGRTSVEGTDSGGTILISTGTVPSFTNGENTLVSLKFKTPYAKTPHVLLTAVGLTTGSIGYYVSQTPQGFTIFVTSLAKSSSDYAFNYWVIQ
jgi:cytoskeletal protein CcmA (bactofilin family)